MRLVFRRVVLGISSLLIGLGVLLGTMGNLSHKSYLAALLAAVLLAGGLLLIRKTGIWELNRIEREQPAAVCASLVLLCLLVNGCWVLFFRPIQAPDYQTFFQTATDLANGRTLEGKDYVAMFPHILGYAAFLSIFLRMFGDNILTAALVNVFLTTLSGLILYDLCRRYCGIKAAFLSFLLWIFCPSKLLYNTMSLPEPFYTCLLLLFFLLVSLTADACADKQPIGKATLTGLLAGLILGLVNAARPIGLIPIIAFFIWLLFLSDWQHIKAKKKTVILFSCLLLLTYGLTGSLWRQFAAAKLEQAPPSVPGYSIYVGFNPETQGSYADEDMDLLQGRYFGEYDRNAEKAQRSMLDSARQRIRETKGGIPGLMIHKLGTLLGHDEGGAFYSKESLSDRQYALWCVASNVWYYLICLLALAGIRQMWVSDSKDSRLLVPLTLTGVILAQLLVEVAARYHYCLIPMLLLLAAPFFEKKNPSA